MRGQPGALVLLAWCLSGLGVSLSCGADPENTSTPPAFYALAAQERLASADTQFTWTEALDLLSVDGGGKPLWSSVDRVFIFENQAPQRLRLFTEEADSLGQVLSLGATSDGRLRVGTTTGLFRRDGLYLVREGPHPVSSQFLVQQGPLRGTWMVSEGALLLEREQQVVQVELPEPALGPVVASQTRVLVLGSSGLWLLERPNEVWLASQLNVTASIFGASADGLWMQDATAVRLLRDEDDASAWAPVTLDGAALRVSAMVSAHPKLAFVNEQGVWLASANQAEWVRSSPSLRMAIAGNGLWTFDARPRTITGYGLEGASFAVDVRPFLEQYCTGCHPGYATIDGFAPRALEALRRLETGDMPRCANNEPCSEGLPLTEYQVIQAWTEGGQLP